VYPDFFGCQINDQNFFASKFNDLPAGNEAVINLPMYSQPNKPLQPAKNQTRYSFPSPTSHPGYYDDGPRVYQRRVYRNYDNW
jgi:hypothetical protein